LTPNLRLPDSQSSAGATGDDLASFREGDTTLVTVRVGQSHEWNKPLAVPNSHGGLVRGDRDNATTVRTERESQEIARRESADFGLQITIPN
jgi:hypothetical protein